MPQYVADLAERSALAQHLGGQSMAKLVCSVSRRMDPGTLERMTNDRSNATGTLKATDRGLGAQKYASTGARWPSILQIRGDRFANLDGLRATRGAGRSCRVRSMCRCSSRCHQVREMPLHLNAIPVVRVAAKWHSRDVPSRCADRCWPTTDGLDPLKSRAGSTASTSWARWEPRRPNPGPPRRDNGRTSGRSATHWS